MEQAWIAHQQAAGDILQKAVAEILRTVVVGFLQRAFVGILRTVVGDTILKVVVGSHQLVWVDYSLL
jgi:hypothetical protein